MNPNRMALKSNREKFHSTILRELNPYGLVDTGNEVYRYSLESRAGTILITFWEDDLDSVFCRFENPQLAKHILGEDKRLNTFSGKWNFHFLEKDLDYRLATNFFLSEIKKVIEL
jgi:hypothetical protein